MAGSGVSIYGLTSSNEPNQTMAMNAIVDHWKVEYARFVPLPPARSTTHQEHPLLVPLARNLRGYWISTSSPSSVPPKSSSASAGASGDASLKLMIDCSADAVLNLSVRFDVLEEHRISKLNFTWPQVSCVSGFPERGARAVFVSYKDCSGQVQKFILRFSTTFEAERFIHVLKGIVDTRNGLPGAKSNSELSSQSEFVPAIGLPFRAEEDCRNTTTTEIGTDQGQESLSYEVDTHSLALESTQDCEAEETLSDFPPSFTSFLKNCCPASETVQSSIPERFDLKAQVARYLGDSSFHDMLTKVEKIICEMGDGVI